MSPVDSNAYLTAEAGRGCPLEPGPYCPGRLCLRSAVPPATGLTYISLPS
jgi:hypothetical protein